MRQRIECSRCMVQLSLFTSQSFLIFMDLFQRPSLSHLKIKTPVLPGRKEKGESGIRRHAGCPTKNITLTWRLNHLGNLTGLLGL